MSLDRPVRDFLDAADAVMATRALNEHREYGGETPERTEHTDAGFGSVRHGWTGSDGLRRNVVAAYDGTYVIAYHLWDPDADDRYERVDMSTMPYPPPQEHLEAMIDRAYQKANAADESLLA
ncbi:MAG: hypothetical protein SVU88_00950 [Candidatus Nanohaloarchaea archaeon]|nr:hypothetical protein [Candidatus Nanohaloarchaea archaeon]